MPASRVGLIGASGLLGRVIASRLRKLGFDVVPFGRSGESWSQSSSQKPEISMWIAVAPIWVLPDYFSRMADLGARRLVCLSSTSVFSKKSSKDSGEQELARQLADAENQVKNWSESNEVDWIIFRPTLIYGRGEDKNISEIARFVRKFGFFPILPPGDGLRQPVSVLDVADICVTALRSHEVRCRAYDISGGEVITYREMVQRVFQAMNRPERILPVPRIAFSLAASILRILLPHKQWNFAMAERMNSDLVFDHSAAAQDLGFKPRKFELTNQDVLAS